VVFNFVCAHSLEVAESGPEKKGYKVKITKKWVKEWGPTILISWTVIKVQLSRIFRETYLTCALVVRN
jgi:hypothetical protein